LVQVFFTIVCLFSLVVRSNFWSMFRSRRRTRNNFLVLVLTKPAILSVRWRLHERRWKVASPINRLPPYHCRRLLLVRKAGPKLASLAQNKLL
jgi:hypothetical protein